MIKASLLAACLVPLALAGCGAEAETKAKVVAPLELTGRVVDAADIWPDLIEADFTAQLAALEEDTLAQFVVVSTPSLKGHTISDYGLRLGNGWGIGDNDRDDGVLLIVAPNERKARIEVGKGLEDELPNELCEEFMRSILAEFQDDDLISGTQVGIDLIDRELRSKLEKQT